MIILNKIIDILYKIEKHLARIDYDISKIKKNIGIKEKDNEKESRYVGFNDFIMSDDNDYCYH